MCVISNWLSEWMINEIDWKRVSRKPHFITFLPLPNPFDYKKMYFITLGNNTLCKNLQSMISVDDDPLTWYKSRSYHRRSYDLYWYGARHCAELECIVIQPTVEYAQRWTYSLHLSEVLFYIMVHTITHIYANRALFAWCKQFVYA